jgi:hypothetical protein
MAGFWKEQGYSFQRNTTTRYYYISSTLEAGEIYEKYVNSKHTFIQNFLGEDIAKYSQKCI